MHKEILLVIKTDFSSGQASQANEIYNYHELSEKEKLVIAWNNLLLDVFPEMFELSAASKKLYLCKMSESSLFIELNLGGIHAEPQLQSSIDPYAFIDMQILS